MAGVNCKEGGFVSKWTPEKLRKCVDGMIERYEGTGDLSQLEDVYIMKGLKVSSRTLNRWYTGGTEGATDYSGYSEILDYLRAFREMAASKCASEQKNSYFIFKLKQPRWGGYKDTHTTETTGSHKIELSINGADGKPLTIK